jgi:hypothetical protein
MSESDRISFAAGAAPHGDAAHERSDVNIRGILAFCVGLIVVAAVVHGAVLLLFRYFSAREAVQTTIDYPLAVGQQRLPPEPRLQTNPRGDLQELREHEDELLGSYGWVDKGAGIVRIPIEQALKLTLERGLPARAGTGATGAGGAEK